MARFFRFHSLFEIPLGFLPQPGAAGFHLPKANFTCRRQISLGAAEFHCAQTAHILHISTLNLSL
ncbi:MAG: hypothetical protein IKI64_05240, partial [Clostridia bacterium]|nr:hypothetical protein [Clostridia bacterium]